MNYLLRFSRTTAFADAELIAASYGEVVGSIPQINVVMIDCEPDAAERAWFDERVISVSQDGIAKPIISMPNDPYAATEWHIGAINLLTAWGYSYGEGIVVASLDTGVRITHEDLRDKILPGRCVVTDTDDVTPVHFHGTSTAGVLAASTGNGKGGVGIARYSKILPIRITTATDGSASFYRMSIGIIYAVDVGARVISLSYDGAINDPICAAAARYARERGCVVVSAGVNQAIEYVLTNPETAKDFICISAFASNNARTRSWGSWIDVRAPEGVMAPHSTSDSAYYYILGNSCATPVAAGVCALILSMRPDLGFQDVKQILRQSANSSKITGSTGAWSNLDGYGALDAGAALALAASWVAIGSDTPTVCIKSPAPGDVLFTGTPATVSVYANDSGSISSVKLYLDDVLHSTLSAAPYDFSWTPSVEKTVEIKAVAYDNYQQERTSTVTTVTVVASQTTVKYGINSLSLSGITPNEQFEVRAKFTNSAGDGAWSNWLTFETLSQPPSAPSEFSFDRTGQSFLITYKPGNNNSTVEYQVNGGAWAPASNPMTFGVGYLGQTVTLGFRSVNTSGVSATVTQALTVPDLFCVIYNSALIGTPTEAQVINGLAPDNSKAIASSAIVASAGNGEYTFDTLTASLPANASYKAAFVYSGVDGISNVVISDAQSTLNAYDERDRVRALIYSNGSIAQLPLGDAEKGKNPLVLLNGELKERTTSEGVPVILDGGNLRTLGQGESLVI